MNCKDHWGKMNRKLAHFNGIWCRLKAAYASGRSDDQLMDEAHQVYRSETNKCFTLVYLWRMIHNQPKWTRTYVEEGSNSNEASQRVEGETRPPGQKQAKSKLKGKAESSSVNLCHDDIQLYHDTQALRASTADKMAEVQLRISRDKVEAAHAGERAALANNQKALMDKYTELLMADTSCFTDSQRMEHQLALEFFREKVMGGSRN
ncbi:hypothetical protein BS78_04G031700 [Paspalum vaginatum]|nr:hypothetical protein BS78_04G031700 [Paspalum vaginatum]